MKIKLIAVIFTLLAQSAIAGNDHVPTDRKITKLLTYSDYAVIYFTPGFANTQGCTNTTQTRVVIDMSGGQNKEIYSAALAAATARYDVGFGIGGCYTGPLNYPTIYRFETQY